MSELYPLAQWLWQFNLLFSAQLLLILVLRRPLLTWVGPLPTYRLWLLPLFLLPVLWLENSGLFQSLLPGWLDGMSSGPRGVVGGYLLPAFPTSLEASSLAPLQTASLSWFALAAGLWAFVALAAALLLLSSMYRFARRLRTTSHVPAPETMAQLPLEDVFGRKLSVLLVDDMNSPALFGALRPILLLPIDFLQRYNTEQQRLILAHEAVHLRRRDNMLNLLLTGLRLTFWWNPLIHLAWRRYRMDQELSCDAQALALSASQQQLYARALLKTLSESRMNWSLQPTLSTWSQVRELKERTRMIGLNKNHRARRGLGALALGVCLLLGAASTVLSIELMPAGARLQAAELPAPAVPVQHNEPGMRDDLDGEMEVMEEIETMDAIVEPREPVAIDQYAGNNEAAQRDLDLSSLVQENQAQLLAQLNSAPDLAPEPDGIEWLQPLDAGAANLSPASDSLDAQDKQARRNLRPITIVEAKYPRRALMRGVEGYATVEFAVTATGAVNNVRISSSQPGRIFDRSAISAASQFQFEPVLQNGEAVAVERVRYKFNYKLVDNGSWVDKQEH